MLLVRLSSSFAAHSGNSIGVKAFIWDIGAHQTRARSYTTACGYSSWYTCSFYVVNCSGGGTKFSASPNPTTGDVQVETTETDKTIVIKEIQVTDKFGNVKKKIKGDAAIKKLKINIADLPKDIYIISI